MTTRSDLHRLIDELPEPALPAAERFLSELEAQEAALPAVLRDAPLSDPEPDELEAIAALDRSEPSISDEELKRELGL